MSKIFSFFFFLFPVFCILFSTSVTAASPDGSGPWADSVASSAQGLRKNGTPVPAIRSDVSSALGVAENTTVEGNFYSLGFGGNIVLRFDNYHSGGVVVVEATNPDYPVEKANIELSENGTTWIGAGTVNQDGEISVPQGVCVKYVRVTDSSNPSDFSDDTADGYDVDGVRLTGNTCTPKQDIVIIHKSDCEVTQTSMTSVTNIQNTSVLTSGNKIKNSTGGSNNITTGKAKSKNKAKIIGGSNIAINPCVGCCSGRSGIISTEPNNCTQ